MLSPQPIHMVCMVPRALGALARPMVYHPPPLCAAFRIQIVPASRFTGGRKRGALAWAARPPLTLGGSTIPARFCTFETPDCQQFSVSFSRVATASVVAASGRRGSMRLRRLKSLKSLRVPHQEHDQVQESLASGSLKRCSKHGSKRSLNARPTLSTLFEFSSDLLHLEPARARALLCDLGKI